MTDTELTRLIRDMSRPMKPLALTPEQEALLPGGSGGSKLRGIRAVLFDLYGTLFISAAGDIAAGLDSAGSGDGASLSDLSGYFCRAVEEVHREARRKGVFQPEVDVEKIWASYDGPLPPGFPPAGEARELALRYELGINPVYPMPGAEECIRFLAGRGIVLGIISNAQFFSPLLFDAFFNAPPEELGFDPALLVYSYKEGEAKPSSRLFEKPLAVLSRRGIEPGEILYTGNDMRNDIAPAAAAGCKTALFAGDRRSLRLRENDPEGTLYPAGSPAYPQGRPTAILKNLWDLQTAV